MRWFLSLGGQLVEDGQPEDQTGWALSGAGSQEKNEREGEKGRKRSTSTNGSVAF